MNIITKEQVKQYDRIREILGRIRMTCMTTHISRDAVQRSARRLEVLEGDSSLMLNTVLEMDFFYEYCIFNYRVDKLNIMESFYEKSHQDYKGDELEILKKAKVSSFKFLKLVKPIKEKGVLVYDELQQKEYNLLDKNLHKSFTKNLKNSDEGRYILSYIIEFEDFIITTGAAALVNIDENAGKLVHERFKKYLKLISQNNPDTIDTAQYITDMHKIALHEEIVLEMPSEILPFGEEALKERVMLSKTAH